MTNGELADYAMSQFTLTQTKISDWRPAGDIYVDDLCFPFVADGKDLVSIPYGIRFWLGNGDSIIYVKKKPPEEDEESSKDESAQARLLTLDELRALPVGAVVWYEQRALLQTYIMPMIVTEDNHIGNWALGVCMDVIGQDDRCWSARPTDEQREATPWRV